MTAAIFRIDEKITQILRRPRMFSASPESLEVTLFTLEMLRRQIISDTGVVTEDSSDFLATVGHDAMSPATFARARGMTDVNEIYKFVVTNWKEFLTKNRRPI